MIYLIGAGPGDSGLLTLRGHEILMKADVVIYDHLVGEGILAMIPDTAEKIDAGKTAENHKISQRNIETLMIEKAKAHKNVIRLKGGDPFLFGRGGEEAQALIEAGLDFEIVPGVSSAIAVPAWAGIPVTHRNFSSGVNIFTAHDKNNLIPDFENSSQVFLMGVGNSGELEGKLLEKFSPLTPCAIISKGTTARQKVIRTSLKNLHDAAKKISPPAVIIVGKVAELNLDWRKNLPLNNKKILITRPQGRSEKLASMLRDAGAEVIAMPTIKTSVIKNSLDNKKISGYDFIGFTSVTGVEAFFELLRDSDRDVREIGGAKIAAIGRATAEALKQHGLKVDFVPEVFCLESLFEGLEKSVGGQLSGRRVLMFRALVGGQLPAELSNDIQPATNFDEIHIYKTEFVKLTHVPNDLDFIIFTSASTVKGFVASGYDMRDVNVICIGRPTAEEAERFGFTNIKISKTATVEDIVKTLYLIVN